MIRIGIVGTNYGCQVQLPAFRLDPRCHVVALAGGNAAQAAERARQHGIPQDYGDWTQMIAQAGIDAIAIAVPPRLQPEIAIHALERGKAVLLEKPLAADWPGAQAVAACARSCARPVAIDFEFAELPTWRRAKALIDDGALGALRHVIVTWNVETYSTQMRLDSWKTRGGDGGGVLGNLCSHTFYYLEHLCGRINGLSARLFALPGADASSQSTLSMTLEFVSGAAGSAAVSAASFLGSGHRIELYGEDGTLALINPTNDYMRGFELFHARRPDRALQQIEVDEPAEDRTSDGRIAPVARLVKRFIDAIEGGTTVIPGIDEALRVQRLIEVAQSSHHASSKFMKVNSS